MQEKDALQKWTQAVTDADRSAARKRLAAFFDSGSFVELDRFACTKEDKLSPAAVVAGYGTVDGDPVYAFAQDKDVCHGAVGMAEAAKIAKVYDLAAQNGAPVIGLFDSDGARLAEGLEALDAVAEILAKANALSGVVPQIAVILGSCVGSAALVAAGADLVVATENADYYLNPGDESAEADITAENAEAAVEAARALLSYLPSNNLSVPAAYEPTDLTMGDTACTAEAVADAGSFTALSKKTALLRIGGTVCGAVALRSEDKICCCSAGKIARFVRFCDAFSIPVVTFVDAAGFQCLKGAAKVAQAYAEATVAKVSVITGRAYGAVYVAAAGKKTGADAVLAWPEAAVSALAPETAVELFWADRLTEMTDPATQRAQLAEEYRITECSPLSAAAVGCVTDVIDPAETKAKLAALLEMLAGKRVSRLPKKHANIQL